MSMVDVFWILLIVSILQPAFRQGMLEYARMKVMRSLERIRGTRVIALVHRQETISFLGYPVLRYIDIHDAESILRAIRLTDPSVPIDLVLHTPGGFGLPAEQIARAVHRHPGKVTAFVPHYAMSGATLIALAADALVMTENSVLGSLDVAAGQYPASSVLKALEMKPYDRVDDETWLLGDVGRKALQQREEFVREMATEKFGEEVASRLVDKLVHGPWTLDYPISVEELTEIGLPVSTDMPMDVLMLMNLFPQPRRQRPSVDFIPEPYESASPGKEGGAGSLALMSGQRWCRTREE